MLVKIVHGLGRNGLAFAIKNDDRRLSFPPLPVEIEETCPSKIVTNELKPFIKCYDLVQLMVTNDLTIDFK